MSIINNVNDHTIGRCSRRSEMVDSVSVVVVLECCNQCSVCGMVVVPRSVCGMLVFPRNVCGMMVVDGGEDDGGLECVRGR